jgi:hypothetical protein
MLFALLHQRLHTLHILSDHAGSAVLLLLLLLLV